MTKEELNNLRETFRQRMKEEDFCIGEAQVEKLFRELLEEPEPIEEIKTTSKPISAQEMAALMDIYISNSEYIFDKDDTFYKRLKK